MKRIVLIALITLSMIGLFAANQVSLLARPSATGGEIMFTANQLYETGHFAQAAQAYQQLIDQGYSDSTLFYNLANAYYRQADHGRAVLNYLRAQRLAPRDPDVAANLDMARARTADQFEPADAGTVQKWLTLDDLAMITLGVWIVGLFLLILVASTRKGSKWCKGLQYALVVTTILLAAGVVALGSYLYLQSNDTAGVIVATEVDVTSGPGTQYASVETLHSGAEVNLSETRGNWVRLTLPDEDLEGWVPASTVEAVTP
jgi:tetratricopeptide (TPR) repeat protein